MRKVYLFISGIILCTLLLGGCLNMGKSKDEKEPATNSEKELMNTYEAENFVPVSEYTGEGFTLRDANPKTGEIAEEHREDVIVAVEDFFQTNYHLTVEVQNIVSAVDGVSVFVESIGEPHIYTFAIVPVDLKNNEVKTDEVWSQEGQVENAIQGGLYAMAYEDTFAHLDETVDQLSEEFPIIGTTQEMIERVKGYGFATTYYFISPNGDIFDDLYDMYMKNPDLTKESVFDFLETNGFEPEEMIITINLFMEEEQVDPSEEILEDIVSQIEELEGAPRGVYSVLLHDNWIDKRRADGMKENTIKRTTPNKIIKK